MKKIVALTILLVPILSSCVESKTRPSQRSSLSSKDISFHNAKQDACWALRDNDKRLIAVKGYGISFPGTPDNFRSAREKEFLLITDTSDSSKDWRESNYNKFAREYAREYNVTILSPSDCSV